MLTLSVYVLVLLFVVTILNKSWHTVRLQLEVINVEPSLTYKSTSGDGFTVETICADPRSPTLPTKVAAITRDLASILGTGELTELRNTMRPRVAVTVVLRVIGAALNGDDIIFKSGGPLDIPKHPYGPSQSVAPWKTRSLLAMPFSPTYKLRVGRIDLSRFLTGVTSILLTVDTSIPVANAVSFNATERGNNIFTPGGAATPTVRLAIVEETALTVRAIKL